MSSFEWDENKYAANLRKHGIAFELIYEFDWVNAEIRSDRRHDYGEERRLAFGRIHGVGYPAVFVIRGGKIRIISLRRARDKELERYGL